MSTGEAVIGFLQSWGALFVATVALIQPWVISIWRKFHNKPLVDVFESGRIEIGYSTFGPTIGLGGTLRGIQSDAFIHNMEIDLIRLSDSLQHKFSWGIFRSSTFSTDFQTGQSIELCSSFLLSKDYPSLFNIQFWDLKTQEEIKNITYELSETWTKAYLEGGGRQILEKIHPNANEVLRKLSSGLFSEFSTSKVYSDAYTNLDRIFYWLEGEYSIKLTIHTSRPDMQFVKTWKFILDKKDSDAIRLNTILLLANSCSQQANPLRFAFADFIAQ